MAQRWFRIGRYISLAALFVSLSSKVLASPVFEITPSTTALTLAQGEVTDVNFTVTNKSGATLTIDRVIPNGNEVVSSYEITSPSPCTTLAHDASCTVSVRFTAQNQAGSLQSDIKVCAFNGALCSTNPTKLTLTVAEHTVRAYIVSQANNSVVQCVVDRVSGNLRDCLNTGATNLNNPYGIAFNPTGTMAFITNWDVGITRCQVDVVTGMFSNCQRADTGSNAFTLPAGITMNQAGDRVYIPDLNDKVAPSSTNHKIKTCNVSSDGFFSNCQSAWSEGFNDAYGVTFSPNYDRIYIATYLISGSSVSNNMISSCLVDPATGVFSDCVPSVTHDIFISPMVVAFNTDGSMVFVTDYLQRYVVKCNSYTATGLFDEYSCWPTPYPDDDYVFTAPIGIALYKNDSIAYVVDAGANAVFRCDVNAETENLENCQNSGASLLNAPRNIVVR